MESAQKARQNAPVECEFVAENVLVSVVPNFSSEKLRFIGGTYGPFRPQRPIRVPLWLAITLKKRQKCKIQPPEVLQLERLQAFLRQEEDTTIDGFVHLPFHYLEVAFLLLECAADDIRNPNQVRTALEDLREQRQAKIRQLFQQLAQSKSAEPVKLTNISMMELSEMRPLLLRSLQEIAALVPRGTEELLDNLGGLGGSAAGLNGGIDGSTDTDTYQSIGGADSFTGMDTAVSDSAAGGAGLAVRPSRRTVS